MSIAEALRRGDPQAFGLLYDEHAGHLYAYCRTLVGDEAGEAVHDTFLAAARHSHTLTGDDALPVWLYTLARPECLRRGASTRRSPALPTAGPLERALARLRPEHREALALSDLEIEDVARVLGVAQDTADLLLRVARRRLEQTVIALVTGAARGDDELFAALGTDTLHRLVAGPAEPPPGLRGRVLAAGPPGERPGGAPERTARGTAGTHPVRRAVRPEEDKEDKAEPPGRRRARAAAAPVRRMGETIARHRTGLLTTVGIAACAAAAVTAFALWPAPEAHPSSNMDGTSVLVHRKAGGPVPLGTSSPWRVPAASPAGRPNASGTPAPASSRPGPGARMSVETPEPPQTTPTPTPSRTPLPSSPAPSPTPRSTPSH